MEIIIANVDNVVFDIEHQLETQIGCQNLPFPGMDSKLPFTNVNCVYHLHSCIIFE